MTDHINRTDVRERLRRLDEEYDIEYQEEAEVSVDPATFPEEVELARSGYLGSSYVWVVRTPSQTAPLSESMAAVEEKRPRVLMILGRGGHAWGIPGGGRETGETFEEGARREVCEETNIECKLTDCFGTRYEYRSAPGHDEVLHMLRVVFTGEYAGGNIAIQPGELNGAAWFAHRPSQVHPLARPVAAVWFEE